MSTWFGPTGLRDSRISVVPAKAAKRPQSRDPTSGRSRPSRRAMQPCPLDRLRRMGPRFREDDAGRGVRTKISRGFPSRRAQDRIPRSGLRFRCPRS